VDHLWLVEPERRRDCTHGFEAGRDSDGDRARIRPFGASQFEVARILTPLASPL
jgi:hypothetical protein